MIIDLAVWYAKIVMGHHEKNTLITKFKTNITLFCLLVDNQIAVVSTSKQTPQDKRSINGI